MVGTIAPLVQVARRQWFVSVSVFLMASVIAGGAFGMLLGSVGAMIFSGNQPWFTTPLLAGAAVVLALIELRVLPLKVPTLYRAVPQRWWTRYGPTRAALAYGGMLGTGVTTFIPFASFYLIPVAAVLLGPLAGSIIGAGYGFGRALAVPLASFAVARGVNAAAIGGWVVGPGPRRQFMKQLCALTLVVFAIGLVV